MQATRRVWVLYSCVIGVVAVCPAWSMQAVCSSLVPVSRHHKPACPAACDPAHTSWSLQHHNPQWQTLGSCNLMMYNAVFSLLALSHRDAQGSGPSLSSNRLQAPIPALSTQPLTRGGCAARWYPRTEMCRCRGPACPATYSAAAAARACLPSGRATRVRTAQMCWRCWHACGRTSSWPKVGFETSMQCSADFGTHVS